jgi:hypothetical protein
VRNAAAAGCEIETLGFVVSTVNVTAALAELFAKSVPEIVTVCWPSLRVGVVKGEVQLFATPLSTLHLVVERLTSVALNWIVGVASERYASAAGWEIETAGWPVSTVNVTAALAEFPTASALATVTVCCPSDKVPVVNGDEQAFALPPSTLQVVEPGLTSVAVNWIDGVESERNAAASGCEIETLGLVVSTVNVTEAF